ncbi:MFS transporter [Yinghuangia sp. YIM S10712]|uniref:MFS transporter n=1 Tax=Yinghuangia sp. YIM S10712 TaxID=3436930 RepID=UPI003F52B83F
MNRGNRLPRQQRRAAADAFATEPPDRVIPSAGPADASVTDAAVGHDSTSVRARDLFDDRRFVMLFLARTISVLGAAFGPVALAFGVLDLPGASATTLTIVLTAQTVPQIALMLFGGVVADRMPRFRLMTCAELLSAAAFLALAVMFVTGAAPLPAVAAAAAMSGIALALYYPALTGVVPDVVAEDRLQTANGVLRFGVNTARLLGMALAGGAVALVGAGWALAVNAAGFAVAAVLLAGLGSTVSRRPPARTSMPAELRDGWREFASRQWLWAIVLQFAFVIAAMQAAFGVLGPVVAESDLGGAPAWSAILAGQGLGTIVGVFVAIRVRPRRPLVVATGMVFPVALPMALLGVGAPVYAVASGAFVTGVAFTVFGVLWETTMQREVPREALSRVSAYDGLGSFMFGPLGLIAAAPLAQSVGPRTALLLCSALVAAATAGALCAPGVRRLRAPAAVEAPVEGRGRQTPPTTSPDSAAVTVTASVAGPSETHAKSRHRLPDTVAARTHRTSGRCSTARVQCVPPCRPT